MTLKEDGKGPFLEPFLLGTKNAVEKALVIGESKTKRVIRTIWITIWIMSREFCSSALRDALHSNSLIFDEHLKLNLVFQVTQSKHSEFSHLN